MKYILMFAIVLGLACADYITGLIKAYCSGAISSAEMRRGGLNKLSELLVMAVACGLEYGIERLGAYYVSTELAAITGAVTAGAVFSYIVIMELISILENYAAVNPDARWIQKIIKRLKGNDENDEQ